MACLCFEPLFLHYNYCSLLAIPQDSHQCEQLAKFPETMVCDATAGTNRERKKLVHVVITNGNLKPSHVCSAVVDSESREAILFVYKALAFMMKNAGLAASLDRTRLLISDFGLGLVQAHHNIAVFRDFGGREHVNVVSGSVLVPQFTCVQ